MPNDDGQEIARFRIEGGARLIPAAGAAMRASALAVGMDEDEATHLGQATEALCTDVAAEGFDTPDDAAFDVALVRRSNEIVVRVDDRGLPFDLQAFRSSDGSTLGQMLEQGFADGLRLSSRGREGNRAELFKRLRGKDVRDDLDIDTHHDCAKADRVPDDAAVEIRFLAPSESLALSRCVYRSYGYSYDAEWVYQPDRIAEKLESGLMRSIVGVSGDDIVGHLALSRRHPDDCVGEAGQAVVDPRWRGHHLFTSLKRNLCTWASSAGLTGMYSEATAAHPYSQKANLSLGAHETGLLLGYIPATVTYEEISEAPAGRRQSATLMYLKSGDGADHALHAPAADADIIRRILDVGALPGTLSEGPGVEFRGDTRFDVEIRRDHAIAVLRARDYGADFRDVAARRLNALCAHDIDCIHVDLPLADPGTARAGADLEALGFFFGGVFPHMDDGTHVLRLQYLNQVDVRPDDVSVASPFGQELLDHVVLSKERAANA